MTTADETRIAALEATINDLTAANRQLRIDIDYVLGLATGTNSALHALRDQLHRKEEARMRGVT